MQAYIGIDGGGTKTRAVVVTSDGRIVWDHVTDGCNVNHYGWPHAQRVLLALFDELRSRLPLGAAVSMYLGLAGVDRVEDVLRMQAFVQEQWPDARVCVENDTMPALVSGSGTREGIVLIGGTGSIAFGINAQGEQCRIGGWGYLIGDEGSGYDIGKRALRSVMQSFDGRLPNTGLTPLILERCGANSPAELIPLVYSDAFTRDRIGDLAREVFVAASAGDSVAIHILESAASELCQLVAVLLQRLSFSQAIVPVVLTGGLFHEGSLLIELVRARLKTHVYVMRNERPPVVGAVILAQQLSGDAATSEFAGSLVQIS